MMINLTDAKQRILYYIDTMGIPPGKFYKQTGVSYGILSQNSNMSEKNLVKILTTYRDISINWLIMGEGPMLKTDAKERVEGAIIIERIEELIRKNSESLIAEIKNLNKKTKPQPYQEPPIPLNNLVAEEEIEEIKKTDRLEKKGKK